MDIKKLQEEFVQILANIIATSTDEEIKKEKTRALEIINELKDHINDNIEYSGRKITALGWLIYLINQRGIQTDNKQALEELEAATRRAGGKISQGKPKSFLAKLPLYAILPVYLYLDY